jgi:hypothetical protein
MKTTTAGKPTHQGHQKTAGMPEMLDTLVDEENSNSNREGTNSRDSSHSRESREETTAEGIHQKQA